MQNNLFDIREIYLNKILGRLETINNEGRNKLLSVQDEQEKILKNKSYKINLKDDGTIVVSTTLDGVEYTDTIVESEDELLTFLDKFEADIETKIHKLDTKKSTHEKEIKLIDKILLDKNILFNVSYGRFGLDIIFEGNEDEINKFLQKNKKLFIDDVENEEKIVTKNEELKGEENNSTVETLEAIVENPVADLSEIIENEEVITSDIIDSNEGNEVQKVEEFNDDFFGEETTDTNEAPETPVVDDDFFSEEISSEQISDPVEDVKSEDIKDDFDDFLDVSSSDNETLTIDTNETIVNKENEDVKDEFDFDDFIGNDTPANENTNSNSDIDTSTDEIDTTSLKIDDDFDNFLDISNTNDIQDHDIKADEKMDIFQDFNTTDDISNIEEDTNVEDVKTELDNSTEIDDLFSGLDIDDDKKEIDNSANETTDILDLDNFTNDENIEEERSNDDILNLDEFTDDNKQEEIQLDTNDDILDLDKKDDVLNLDDFTNDNENEKNDYRLDDIKEDKDDDIFDLLNNDEPAKNEQRIIEKTVIIEKQVASETVSTNERNIENTTIDSTNVLELGNSDSNTSGDFTLNIENLMTNNTDKNISEETNDETLLIDNQEPSNELLEESNDVSENNSTDDTNGLLDDLIEQDNNTNDNSPDLIEEITEVKQFPSITNEDLIKEKKILEYINKHKNVEVNVFPKEEFVVKKEGILDKFSTREKLFALGFLVLMLVLAGLSWYIVNIVNDKKVVLKSKEQEITTITTSNEQKLAELKKENEELLKSIKEKEEQNTKISGSSDSLTLGAIEKIKVDEKTDTKMTTSILKNKYLVINFQELSIKEGQKLSIVLKTGGSVNYIIKTKINAKDYSILEVIDAIEKKVATLPEKNRYFILISDAAGNYYVAQP